MRTGDGGTKKMGDSELEFPSLDPAEEGENRQIGRERAQGRVGRYKKSR